MNQTQNPGAPQTDELARNAARNGLRDRVEMFVGRDEAIGSEAVADYVVAGYTVTWERDVNRAGVAVRRYVLRGEWEVDPEPRDGRIPHGPVTPTLRARDVVRYLDRRDGGREWTVQSIENLLDLTVSMTSPGVDEVAEHQYARADELELVQRTVRPGEALPIGEMRPGVMYKMASSPVVVDDPAQDDLTPAQHRRVADELGNARREGYAEALRMVAEGIKDSLVFEDDAAAQVVTAAAGQLGVTL